MRTERRAVGLAVAAVAVAALAVAGLPRAASADRLSSNSQLLGRTVHVAMDSVLASAPLKGTDAVVVLPAAGQRPEWALENEIAVLLQRRVARVTFHGATQDSFGAPVAPPAPTAADSASGDTAAAKAAAIHHSLVDPRPLDPSSNLLEYRIASLAVRYTDVHKTRLFSSGEVDRMADVSVGLRLLGPDGKVLWAAHARGQAADRIPEARLSEVEDRLYFVPPPVLPDRSLTRLLEPAIVVSLVAGLVFLFYTNRN